MPLPRFTPPSRPTIVNPNPSAFAPIVDAKPAETESIDFQARIDSELQALNAAVTDHEQDNGQTAATLAEAKRELARLHAELNAAERRLQTLEQAGSALQKFNGAVSRVEGGLQKLIELLTKNIQTDILTQWYGHAVSIQAISADRKRDLGLHKRIQDLRKFVIVSSFDPRATVEQVNKRADVIGTKFLELRDHVEKDSAR